MTKLYYCYHIPMGLWIIDNFADGTRAVNTKEYWDSFIGKDTKNYKLVKANDDIIVLNNEDGTKIVIIKENGNWRVLG